jgi:catechol 2,3-dioxygenase-like lactoylglutathione lyase family enzyme
MADSTVSVRYLVDDVQAAIDFYTGHLGFTLGMEHVPAFAEVTRGNLRLLLSGPLRACLPSPGLLRDALRAPGLRCRRSTMLAHRLPPPPCRALRRTTLATAPT